MLNLFLPLSQPEWKVKLQMGSAPLFVVGNLPYSITTDALISLVKYPGAIRYAQVMVQKEAADRMAAAVGSKDYSVLSVMLQAYTKVRQLYLVPPTAFYPQPKVISSVVELDFLDASKASAVHVETLLEVCKESFRQRKRVLKHSLKAYTQKRRLPLPLRFAKLRAEQLTPSDFLELAMSMSRWLCRFVHQHFAGGLGPRQGMPETRGGGVSDWFQRLRISSDHRSTGNCRETYNGHPLWRDVVLSCHWWPLDATVPNEPAGGMIAIAP